MARIPGLNVNFDNISSATISRYVGRKYKNHVPSHHPLLFKIWERGNAMEGHGYQYSIPIRVPSPVGPKVSAVTDGYLPLPPPVEMGGFTDYTYTPAMFAMNVALDEYDIAAQGPGTTIIPYYQAKIDSAFDSFNEFYQASIWAAENALGSAGNYRGAMGSLRTYVNGGGTSTTGGALPPSKPNQTTAAVGTTPITLVAGVERNQTGGAYVCPNLFNPASPATPSVQLLAKVYNSTILNGAAADLIIMGEDLYGYFDSVVAAQQRYTGTGTDLATVGFESFNFKRANVVFDDNCPSDANQLTTNQNNIFCLSTENFFLYYNTMAPKFVRKDYPDRPLQNYQGLHILQLCSDHLGRRQARHAKVAQPS